MDYSCGKCVFVFLCDPVMNQRLVQGVTPSLPDDSEAPSGLCKNLLCNVSVSISVAFYHDVGKSNMYHI